MDQIPSLTIFSKIRKLATNSIKMHTLYAFWLLGNTSNRKVQYVLDQESRTLRTYWITIVHLQCGSHSISINICGVWGSKGRDSSLQEGSSHIYTHKLDQSRNSILYLKKRKKKREEHIRSRQPEDIASLIPHSNTYGMP